MEKVKKNKSPAFIAWFTVEWLEVTERLRKSGADLKRIQIVAKESEDPDD